MKKVYMVGVETPEPRHRVRMDEVYCFQASTRTLSRCEVQGGRQGSEEERGSPGHAPLISPLPSPL